MGRQGPPGAWSGVCHEPRVEEFVEGDEGGDRDLSQLLILMDVSVLTVTPTMRVYTWASLCAKPETRYQRLPKAEICPGLGGQGRITHDSVIPRPC